MLDGVLGLCGQIMAEIGQDRIARLGIWYNGPMSTTNVLFSDLPEIQQALLDWFAEHGRDLPWRRTRDPYRVLVSEIMLQQTQVDRVLPKYTAFLERFPRLEDLADAPSSEVIRLWSGLGYNRRAVNLQRTARAVLDEHAGEFPRSLDALLALPGVGPYTAGAIACFAFEQDVAFMDTNIRRALRRLFVGPDESAAAQSMTDKSMQPIAQAAIPVGKAWSWNQAIMELGATICTAAKPACWRCPLRQFCTAYRERQNADSALFSEASYLEQPRKAQATRRVTERREQPFVGSNRFFRGRVVAALRTLPEGASMSLSMLGPQVKDDYSEADREWLEAIVMGLVRDGLAQRSSDGGVQLPD
jgi:A/G-specific adenine glycosylase